MRNVQDDLRLDFFVKILLQHLQNEVQVCFVVVYRQP